MDMRHIERTQMRKPTPPPVELGEGRLDLGRAGLAGAYVLIALVVAALGAWLVTIADADTLLRIFGGAVVVVSLAFGGVTMFVSVTEWLDYRRRIDEWHTASLEAYQTLQGETYEHVSVTNLSADTLMHVLIAAIWVQRRLNEGTSASYPYSIRSMYGPVFFNNRRVGDMSKLSAEEMGRRFEQLGLITGRSERTAGTWVPQSTDQVIDMVLRKWN